MDPTRCGGCLKRFRHGDRQHALMQSPDLYTSALSRCHVVIKNLIDSTLVNSCTICHTCYCAMYRQMQNDQSSIERDESNRMEIDDGAGIRRREIGVQTDEALCVDQPTQTSDASISSSTQCSQTTPRNTFALSRLAYSHRICSVCGKLFEGQLTTSSTIGDMARVHLLLNHQILVRRHSRCCSAHLIDGHLDEKAIHMITTREKEYCEITDEEWMEMLCSIKDQMVNMNSIIERISCLPPLNFDDHNRFSSASYYILTGLTLSDFDRLCAVVPSWALRDSALRSPRMAIACFLCKIRLGLSNRALAPLFSFPDKRAVGRINESVCSVSFFRMIV
jgi:hypothetical protein